MASFLEPRGNLCLLFSRSTSMNIATYIVAVLIVVVVGILWIYGSTRNDKTEQDKWKSKGIIVGVIGIIIVSFMIATNLIHYELSFNEKCRQLESWINVQVDKVKQNLTTEALSNQVSRVITDTVTNQLKGKLASTLKETLLGELKSLTQVGNR